MNPQTATSSEARSDTDWAFFLYQRTVCGFLLVLLAVTWPLWVPTSTFPAVPVLELLCPVPGMVDLALLVIVVLSSVMLLFLGPNRAWSAKLWMLLAATLFVGFLLNQHRFQPWAYQMAVLAVFFSLAPPALARRLATWLTLSIYFYSAISKLNPSFVDELGSDFLWTLGSFVGWDWNAADVASWKWLALGFPLFEFAAFLLLLGRRTHRVGVVVACLMHVGLLVMLGPFGLSHSWSVLLWNLFFIAQAIMLFWLPRQGTGCQESQDAAASSSASQHGGARGRLAQAVCAIVLLFPVLELAGLGDPWPAWGLYASHVGRAHLFLSRHVAGALSPELQKFVADDAGDQLYVPVRLNRWSLEATGAPIYPGSRFAFAVGRAFVAKTNTANFARFVIESPAGRFRGERQSETVAGARLGHVAEERFWLNTQARDYYLAGSG